MRRASLSRARSSKASGAKSSVVSGSLTEQESIISGDAEINENSSSTGLPVDKATTSTNTKVAKDLSRRARDDKAVNLSNETCTNVVRHKLPTVSVVRSGKIEFARFSSRTGVGRSTSSSQDGSGCDSLMHSQGKFVAMEKVLDEDDNNDIDTRNIFRKFLDMSPVKKYVADGQELADKKSASSRTRFNLASEKGSNFNDFEDFLRYIGVEVCAEEDALVLCKQRFHEINFLPRLRAAYRPSCNADKPD